MLRFVLIALAQFAATWTATAVMGDYGGGGWLWELIRGVYFVLAAPVVLAAMGIATWAGMGLPLLLPTILNALVWSAVIGRLLDARSERRARLSS